MHLLNLQKYAGFFYDALKRYQQASGEAEEKDAEMWLYNSIGYVQTQLVIFQNTRSTGPIIDQVQDKKVDIANKLNYASAWCKKPLAIKMKYAVDQMLDDNPEMLN